MSKNESFNEQTLYNDIVKIWGENGAHADLFREMMKRLGLKVEKKDKKDYNR